MKKLIVFMTTLFIVLYCVNPVFAKGKSIQFHMILPKDAKTTGLKYNFISKKGKADEDVMVGKDILFSNDDIDTIIISERRKWFVGISPYRNPL